MSENNEETQTEETVEAAAVEETATEETAETPAAPEELKLNGLFAFKQGMSHVYNDKGEMLPVTVLTYEPWVVSQLKTEEKESYTSIQMACRPRPGKQQNGAGAGHLKKAGFENGAYFVREMRQSHPDGIAVGQKISINSLAKGDNVSVTGRSKGHGFSGVMKRWNFGGGRASHGSGFHRKPGSIGNCTWPGRVMKGRKMAGQFGNETTTLRNLEIVDILTEENVILVKGAVPGSRNSLVRLVKA